MNQNARGPARLGQDHRGLVLGADRPTLLRVQGRINRVRSTRYRSLRLPNLTRRLAFSRKAILAS